MSAATYISSTSYKHSGNYSSIIKPGQAIICDNGVDGTSEDIVSTVSYSAGYTTVVAVNACCSTNLTDVKYGPTYADTSGSSSNLGNHFHTGEHDGGYLAISNLNDTQVTFLQTAIAAWTGSGILRVVAGVPDDSGAIDDLSDVDASSPSDNDVLVYDSGTGKWEPENVNASELGDTTISSPADAELLVYDSGTSKWINQTISLHESVSDVQSGAASDGDILEWDDYTGMWEAISFELDSLNDVAASSPSDGDALIWDDYTGSWINGLPAIEVADLDDVSASAPNHGDVLTYNAYTAQWEATAP